MALTPADPETHRCDVRYRDRVSNLANQDGFRREVEQFRREILAHCYRMLGSLHDAEDAYQDTLIRAWRGRDGFAGRSSFRTWLHRIATNVCLDAIGDRKARTMPELIGPAGSPDARPPDPDNEIAWLEPYPDEMIGDSALGPDARYSARESITIAFTVALQLLPPRQRAALLMRDVLGLSAEESADALDMTVPAINSALQRARAAIEQRPKAPPVTEPTPGLLDLIRRYTRAWESGDTAALIAVLRDDAIFSMPPIPLWIEGSTAIGTFYDRVLRQMGAMRTLESRANGSIAIGTYNATPDGYRFSSLAVLSIAGDRIAAIHSFLGGCLVAPGAGGPDPARFGLPTGLDKPE
jgi:RNA polymerase sigma-70 factor (ECF subfamily)